MTPKRTKAGRFKRGARVATVGAKPVPTTKGTSIVGDSGKLVSPLHTDADPLETMGRRVTTQQGGLNNRADWVRLQSGGLSPSELLRVAGD